MANELSNLKPVPGSTKARTRLGRGEGSGKGRTGGHGLKGQKKRGSLPARFEGGQMPLHRRMPKRGFTNIFAKDYTVVRLDLLAERTQDGETVDATVLKERGIISKIGRDGIKILGNGDIGHKLVVKAAAFTKSAAEKIAKAGGTAEVIA